MIKTSTMIQRVTRSYTLAEVVEAMQEKYGDVADMTSVTGKWSVVLTQDGFAITCDYERAGEATSENPAP